MRVPRITVIQFHAVAGGEEETITAQHAAAVEKEQYEQKIAAIDREAKQRAELNERRAGLRPNDVVRVSRFDKTGKVVRVDAKKQTVTVSVGLGQWEIPFEEIFPAT